MTPNTPGGSRDRVHVKESDKEGPLNCLNVLPFDVQSTWHRLRAVL